MPDPVSIQVAGNVDGNIVVGDNNFVVNNNHGTIVYHQAAPQVRPRAMKPAPPRAPRGFVGRASELEKLEGWIAAGEMTLVHAPDGLGKSALLRQAANSPAARAMPDGVLLVEGVDVNGQALGADDLLQQMFDALFESNPPLKVTLATARTYLSNTRPLIVMDEVALPPALQRSLPDLFPKAAFLLAADTPAAADAQRLPLKPLLRADALALLAQKAAITVNDANRQQMDLLCAVLRDMPLALTIVGNVLRDAGLSLPDVLTRLQNTPVDEADPLRAALDRAYLLAYGLLTPDEQKLMATAAFTPGISMSPDWLQFALGSEKTLFIERLRTLGLLYNNSPRLRIPAGLRQAALRQAQQITSAGQTLANLGQFVAQFTDSQDISAELGNFLAALQYARQTENWPAALRLAQAINPTLVLRGLWDTWERALQSALQAARQLRDGKAEAWALHELGTRQLGLGNRAAALESLRQALSLRKKLGDNVGAAYTQHNLNLLLPPVPPKPPTNRLLGPLTVLGLGALLLMMAAIPVLWLVLQPTPTPRPEAPTATLVKTPPIAPTVTNPNEPPIASSIEPTHTSTQTPTVTPTATPDVEAPVITDLEAEPIPSYYGEAVSACGVSSETTFSARAQDPAGVEKVFLRYFYYYSDLQKSEVFEVEMKPQRRNMYTLTIDHNLDSQALNTLDNTDGKIVWEVLAVDKFGNVSEPQPADSLPIEYARCDAFAPQILSAYAIPRAGRYGSIEYCGDDFSSYTQFVAIVEDDSGLDKVYIEYAYRNKIASGPTRSLYLLFTSSGYKGFLDHNAEKQASQVLKEKSGELTWKVVASDKTGNFAFGAEQTMLIKYTYCPPPG